MSHLARASAALAVLALASRRPARSRRRSRSTPRRCARSPRCRPASRRTSAASAARASRRRRSARAASAARRSSASASRPPTATAGRGPRSRSCASSRRRSSARSRPRPPPRRRDADHARRHGDADAGPEPREFRLTLLHNNDGESKYVTGDSIANYGGIARFKTVLDRLRADADAAPVDENTDKGTLTISSGDNFLAGLNLRASFNRFDAGLGPFYDSDAMGLLGYDAVTIGNHEFDFGPARLAQFIAFERTGIPFLSANTGFAGEQLLQALRDNGRIADSTVIERDGEQIGVIGVSPPETPTISSHAQRHLRRQRRGHRQRRGRAPDRRGREQDHPVLAPAEHRQREERRRAAAQRRHRHLRRRRRPAGQPGRPAAARRRTTPRSARIRRWPRTRRAPTCRSSPPRASTATSAA